MMTQEGRTVTSVSRTDLVCNACAEVSIRFGTKGAFFKEIELFAASHPEFCKSSLRFGGNVRLVIRAPVKGECLRETRLLVKAQPKLCELVVDLVTEAWSQERIHSIPSPLIDKLLEIGLVIPNQIDPKEVNFCCQLNENLLKLVPYRHRTASPIDVCGKKLVLNEGIYLEDQVSLLGERCPDTQALGPNERGIIWVDDPGTRILSPYWTSTRVQQCVRDLICGQILPSSIKSDLLRLLSAANILVSPSWTNDRLKQWQKIVNTSRESLQCKQYAVIPRMVHPLQLSALRRYFRALNVQGFLSQELTSRVVSKRRIRHNEKVTRFLHQQIVSLIKRITAEEIKPSYSMLCVYFPEAFLRRHIDREQCVWNLSLLVDADPETDRSQSWPIYLDVDRGGPQRVSLEIGDGVLFRGTKTPHWRDELPSERTVTVVFFHFVPIQFKASLD